MEYASIVIAVHEGVFKKNPLYILLTILLSLPFTLCILKTHILSRFPYYLVIRQPLPLSTTNGLLRSTAVIGSKPQSNKVSSRYND